MKKILVCDDDPGIQEVMKIILESNGYKVKSIFNGRSVEKQVVEFYPNFIFMDLWMPGIDGREIIKLLKRNPQTKDIPVFIISALNDIKGIAENIGADGYLEKPFEVDQLIKIIDSYAR